MNLTPDRERVVAVADVDVPLAADALSALLVGREAYRRTRYIVVRRGDEVSLVEVRKAPRADSSPESADAPLFSPITDVRVLATPDECAVVHDPSVDIAVPSQLTEVARGVADARCIVVYGRYEYVGFILDPSPVRVRVVDVVPPEPSKLLDQARRVLAVAEDLPPIQLEPEILDVRELAEETDAPSLLFPCRASGLAVAGRTAAYLDQRPPRSEWLMVGCTRSRDIHRWFYGDEPPAVDTCPRRRVTASSAPTLVRCCLLEQGMERDGHTVVVPWGASLDEVRSGLVAAAGAST